MLAKVQKTKGTKLVVAASLVGLGLVTSIPATTYAMENQAGTSAAAMDEQQTNTITALEVNGVQLTPQGNEFTASVGPSDQNFTLKVVSGNPNAKITVNLNGQPVEPIGPDGQPAESPGTNGQYLLQSGDTTFQIIVDDGVNSPNTYTLTVTRTNNGNTGSSGNSSGTGTTTTGTTTGSKTGTTTTGTTTGSKTGTTTTGTTTGSKTGTTTGSTTGTTTTRPTTGTMAGTTKTGTTPGNKHGSNTGSTTGFKTGTKAGITNKVKSPTTKSGAWSGAKSGTKAGAGNFSNISKSGTYQKTGSSSSFQQKTGTVQKVSTATLSSLTVSEGTWDSSFTSNKYTYHIAEPSNITSVTIDPTATYSSADYTIEGSTSETVKLTENSTAIPIVVTRGNDRKTYVLVFDKPVPQAQTTPAISQQTTDTSGNSAPANVTTTALNPQTSVSSYRTNQDNSQPASFWSKIWTFLKNLF